MTSKSDSIGVTCTRLWHFADTFSQWNSCWKKLTLGHMTENKCGYQMHIFVTSFSAQHAPAWRCFCMVQPLRQPFRPKCTNRILQMHHQNPVVPPESGAHPQNPVCTYSVNIVTKNSVIQREMMLNMQSNHVTKINIGNSHLKNRTVFGFLYLGGICWLYQLAIATVQLFINSWQHSDAILRQRSESILG